MKIISTELGWYVEQLKNNHPFSFVRYGNGEWDCILKKYHKTRSGSQTFTPNLQAALIRSLTHPVSINYYRAMQSVSFLQRVGLWSEITQFLQYNKNKWYDAEILHKASRKGKLFPFIDEIQKKKLVIVGPQWLKKLPFDFKFIPVVSKNCWSTYNCLFDSLKHEIESVILFSAGPTTKVLISTLFPIVGKTSYLIDCGSMWDPFCGVKSRRYHKNMTASIIHTNLVGL